MAAAAEEEIAFPGREGLLEVVVGVRIGSRRHRAGEYHGEQRQDQHRYVKATPMPARRDHLAHVLFLRSEQELKGSTREGSASYTR